MKRIACFVVFLAIVLSAATLAAEPVTFVGLSPPPGMDQLILKANLVKPEGDGPFPAVIMMHGCSGDTPYLDAWEKRLVQWGYVVLRVDGLTPRKQQTFCDDPGDAVIPRAQDAYDAKAYLMGHPFVDKQKIGLIGWSQGATSALYAVNDSTSITDRKTPFQCAVSFYPYCTGISHLNAPLLVLVGEKDIWCPSEYCKDLATSNKSPFEIELKIYENATHCFDWEGPDRVYNGQTMKYNPEAAGDAFSRVQTFLAKYLTQ